VSAISDPRDVNEQFYELVLSDPDLLDIEFGSVLASWNAPPPDAPPKTARCAGRGTGAAVTTTAATPTNRLAPVRRAAPHSRPISSVTPLPKAVLLKERLAIECNNSR
jgi:hypothetical protein